ncbi:MAG: High-affinity branched-chain amino acid transport ATP-binding protein LivF [Alphaproteobacteria bacterium MarineAlpha9_Bin3]|nr:MAG: High-affinity branched-chain amino acid transport ATP-binding protein LivF [Alphaproteobacteria bacterium MarineAlpha9_Bin3]|tara:strand:+ start:3889 stop:4584 length:696 start_codon:yes stop_codon:yes gene_type:complete
MSILNIKNLNTYYGKSHILQGVNLNLDKPGCLALLGRNGAGKSTTLRSIVNLTKPSSGEIIFKDTKLKGLSTYQIAEKGLTMVPENRGMFSSLTVIESLNIINNNNNKWNIERVLESFPQLKSKLQNNSISLSGGEQQMLAISKALLTNPKLILLDEPTQGLAPNIVLELVEILKRILSENISLLIVEQNVNMALEIANEISIIGKGETKWNGTKNEFKKNITYHKEWIGI